MTVPNTREDSLGNDRPVRGTSADDPSFAVLRDGLAIDGAPTVWHDEPPADDYLVDVDQTDDLATEDVPAPIFSNPETLRPARPRPPVAPVVRAPVVFTPHVTDVPEPENLAPFQQRPSIGGRPLPRVGTEALGRCFRITHYGAFVEFAGHRGLIHISKLVPGTHVARVEDVIGIGDEVIVKVVEVDFEQRHVNLALIRPEYRATPQLATDPTTAETATALDEAASHATATIADVDDTATELLPRVATPVIPPTPIIVRGEKIIEVPTPVVAPTAPVIPPTTSVIAPTTSVIAPAAPVVAPTAPVIAPAAPVVAPTAPVVAPMVLRGNDVVPYIPPKPERATTGTRSSAPEPTKRTSAPTRPPAVARAGARAMRRELIDPNHPMARLLALSPGLGTPMPTGRTSASERKIDSFFDDEPVATPEPPRLVPSVRPVHVEEAEEAPLSDEPATLEALAARFGSRQAQPERSSSGRAGSKTSRSQLAREAQARVLGQLRGQA